MTREQEVRDPLLDRIFVPAIPTHQLPLRHLRLHQQLVPAPFTVENARKAEVAWILTSDQPFIAVEHPFYINLQRTLNPEYRATSGDMIRRHVDVFFEQAEIFVQKILSEPGADPEQLFSEAKIMVPANRASLDPATLRKCQLLKQWLRLFPDLLAFIKLSVRE